MKMKTPEHLSESSRELWQKITNEHKIEGIRLRILQSCLEAFDRIQEARSQIRTDGLTVKDKANQVKPHPLLLVEKDSRTAFLRAYEALNLGATLEAWKA